MNKLKVMWILWGMVMVSIVVLLSVFGFTMIKKNKPYKEKENELVDIAKIYVEKRTWYPQKGETIKIPLSKFIEEDLVKDISVEKDKCDGYISVTNDGVIEYKAYLKCNNYKTHNYE